MALIAILTVLVLVSSPLLHAKNGLNRGFKLPLDLYERLVMNRRPHYQDDEPIDSQSEIVNPIRNQDEIFSPITSQDDIFQPISNEDYQNPQLIRNDEDFFQQIENEVASLDGIPTQKRRENEEDVFAMHLIEWCKKVLSIDCTTHPHLNNFTKVLADKSRNKGQFTQTNCAACSMVTEITPDGYTVLSCISHNPATVECFVANKCDGEIEFSVKTTVATNSPHHKCHHCSAASLTMIPDNMYHNDKHTNCTQLKKIKRNW